MNKKLLLTISLLSFYSTNCYFQGMFKSQPYECTKTLYHPGPGRAAFIMLENDKILISNYYHASIYCVKTGECLEIVDLDAIRQLYKLPNGNIAAYASNKITIWNPETNQIIKKFNLENADHLHSLLRDENIIFYDSFMIAKTGGAEVGIWKLDLNASGDKAIKPQLFKAADHVSRIKLLPGGNIAICPDDNEHKNTVFYNITENKVLFELPGEYQATLNNGTIITSNHSELLFWDPNTKAVIQRINTRGEYKIYSFAITEDESKIITGHGYGDVTILDLNTNLLKHIKAHDSHIFNLQLLPNNRFLTHGLTNPVTKVWDLNTGKQLQTLEGHSIDIHSGEKLGSICIAQVFPNDTIVTTGFGTAYLKVWNAKQ